MQYNITVILRTEKRNMNTFTIDDIKDVIHKIDLAKRPYIIFLNPKDAEDLKAQMPEIEDSLVIQSTEYVERGKGFLMKRESLETWDLPFIDL